MRSATSRPKSNCACFGEHLRAGNCRRPPAGRRSRARSAQARAADRRTRRGSRPWSCPRRHVDQRIGDVVVGAKKSEYSRLSSSVFFQIRRHRGEIVGRPRPRPGIVGRRAVRVRARDVIGRHLDRLLVFRAARRGSGTHRRDRAAGSRRRASSPSSSLPISGEIDRSCARRESSRTLPPARRRAAWRHVGRLVPVQNGSGRAQIGDLAQPRLELGQRFLAAHAATSPPPP